MDTIERARELQEELVLIRRRLHQNAETGNNLPQTVAFVSEKLQEMGYQPKEICKGGLLATIGSGEGKTILLRADMDALPILEESGEAFASVNGAMHACGHDLHTTILLGTAKLLKERENEIKGTIKLMFQPAEETLWGGKAMVDAGILENPKVDCALSLHVGTPMECGTVNVRSGMAMSSCNGFKIKIKGKGAHGAQPENGVDPINIGVHIHTALQELIARETPLIDGALLTIGAFNSGTAPNIIPDQAELMGTIRTYNEAIRPFVVERMKTIAVETAKLFRGEAEVEILSDVPALKNDSHFTELIVQYIREIPNLNAKIEEAPLMGGSEDFAFVANEVPSLMFFLGANPDDENKIYPMHHPKIVLNEGVIPIGTTIMTDSAIRWLQEH